jgi:IS30 family transposase
LKLKRLLLCSEGAKRPKSCKLSFNDPLCQLIARKLRWEWSPQQCPERGKIYRSLCIHPRGFLKKGLQECLRSPRAIKRSRHANPKGLKLRRIKDAVPIIERTPEAKERAMRGHWEGDLIVDSNNSYIATLVKRHSRFLMLEKVENKDTQSVITALIKQARKLSKELLSVADMGSWIGDGRAPQVHHRDQDRRVHL